MNGMTAFQCASTQLALIWRSTAHASQDTGPGVFVDHAVELEITPLAVDRTQMISEWYVHEDAVEGVYDVEKLIDLFHITNKEDGALAERNYQGITSARFTPGPLNSMREHGIIDVHKMYREMMAAG